VKKPRRTLSALLAFVLALGVFIPTTLSAGEIGVTINGTPVVFEDQTPVIVDGRTLVPVTDVFRALGFISDWDGAARQTTLIGNDHRVVITIDSDTFFANGVPQTLDVPAQIINGRNMLPIRAVLESVGKEIDWDGGTQTVLITYGALSQSATQTALVVTPTPTPAPTPVPTPTPTPVAQSRMGQWNQISVIGDANFTRNVNDALHLIRTQAPEFYAEVLHYVGILRQHSSSGMWFWLDPPEYRIGTATYNASTIWLATTIVHDAVHSRQAYENPNVFDDPRSQDTFDAEMEAVDRQIEFLRRIGAPQHYIDHSEAVRDTQWWLGDVWWRR